MSHLTLETLARLMDEPPDGPERDHLDGCEVCRHELDALVEQRRSLAELPAIAPPPDQWPALRRRLRDEGLVRRPRRVPAGLARAAAAAFLFVAGGAVGYGVRGPAASEATLAGTPAVETMATDALAETPDPSRGVEQASEAFLLALDRYMSEGGTAGSDPAARLAALDQIVLTTAEALSESPADPVINSYHVTALAQREAVIRQIAAGSSRPIF